MSEFGEAPSISLKNNTNTLVHSWLMDIACRNYEFNIFYSEQGNINKFQSCLRKILQIFR